MWQIKRTVELSQNFIVFTINIHITNDEDGKNLDKIHVNIQEYFQMVLNKAIRTALSQIVLDNRLQ